MKPNKLLGFEEALLGAAVALVLLTTWADVTTYVASAEPSQAERLAYRYLGKWGVLLTPIVQGVLLCFPVGLLGGLLFARRPMVYSGLSALPVVVVLLMYGPFDPIGVAGALIIVLLTLAGGMLGSRVRHPFRVPALLIEQGTRSSLLWGRAVLDVLAFLAFVATLSLLHNIAIGRVKEHTIDAFLFFLAMFAVFAFVRFTVRPRRSTTLSPAS